MASTPSSVSNSSAIDSHSTSRILHVLFEFLIRRRIVLSIVLFTALISRDVALGPKPHSLIGFDDLLGVLGTSLVLSGLGLRSWAAGILKKNTELTTSGPYRLIRNPLYVGSFLMMFGFCTLIGNPTNLLFVAGPVLVMYLVKVRQEERLLGRIFAREWQAYVQRTPRFIPRLGRINLSCEWRFSQWLNAREYQAFCASLAALVAIEVWRLIVS